MTADWGRGRRLGRAVGPHTDGHVVARADEDVTGVRAPCDTADGVFVSGQDGERAAGGVAKVESADDAVDAGGRYYGVVVLVPVVGQDLGGHGAGVGFAGRETREDSPCGRRMDGYDGGEVVFGRDGSAEVVDAKVGVA